MASSGTGRPSGSQFGVAAGQRFLPVSAWLKSPVRNAADRDCNRIIVNVLGLAEFLVTEKEEGLVVTIVDFRNPYWAAKRATVIVPARYRSEQTSVSVVGERHARVERFIDEVIVARTMELISARLHCHVEDATARLSELGRIVTGLNCEFLNGIDARLRLGACALAEAVGGVLPLHQHRLRVVGAPLMRTVEVEAPM